MVAAVWPCARSAGQLSLSSLILAGAGLTPGGHRVHLSRMVSRGRLPAVTAAVFALCLMSAIGAPARAGGGDFPAPDQGGVLDDDTLFYELFEGEPRAKDGYVTLSTAPGLGLELKEDRIRQWRIAG